MTMQTKSTPLAIWDVRDPGWGALDGAAAAWAKAHGIPVNDTYRVEFYEPDRPFARVFTYAVNERGHRYLNPAQHDPQREHDHSLCDPARVPPFDVPLTELPPRRLLSRSRS